MIRLLTSDSSSNFVFSPSCTLVEDEPFDFATRTHGTWAYGSPTEPFCLESGAEPCFMRAVVLPVATEIWTQNTGSPGTRPKNSQYVTTGDISFMFNEFMNTSNVYPYLTANQSNTVYGEIVCRIQTEVELLPPVIGANNTVYAVFMIYSSIYLPFSGPENTGMDITYEVYLQEINFEQQVLIITEQKAESFS